MSDFWKLVGEPDEGDQTPVPFVEDEAETVSSQPAGSDLRPRSEDADWATFGDDSDEPVALEGFSVKLDDNPGLGQRRRRFGLLAVGGVVVVALLSVGAKHQVDQTSTKKQPKQHAQVTPEERVKPKPKQELETHPIGPSKEDIKKQDAKVTAALERMKLKQARLMGRLPTDAQMKRARRLLNRTIWEVISHDHASALRNSDKLLALHLQNDHRVAKKIWYKKNDRARVRAPDPGQVSLVTYRTVGLAVIRTAADTRNHRDRFPLIKIIPIEQVSNPGQFLLKCETFKECKAELSAALARDKKNHKGIKIDTSEYIAKLKKKKTKPNKPDISKLIEKLNKKNKNNSDSSSSDDDPGDVGGGGPISVGGN